MLRKRFLTSASSLRFKLSIQDAGLAPFSRLAFDAPSYAWRSANYALTKRHLHSLRQSTVPFNFTQTGAIVTRWDIDIHFGRIDKKKTKEAAHELSEWCFFFIKKREREVAHPRLGNWHATTTMTMTTTAVDMFFIET